MGTLFEDPIKVRCQDKQSHRCSQGQGVRVRQGSAGKSQMVWKTYIFCKMLLQNQFQAAALKSYLSAAKQTPQSRAMGAWSIPFENTGLHQMRANKDLSKSQQARHCLQKQMCTLHVTRQHQGGGFLGTFHTWKHFSSHPGLVYFSTYAFPSGGLGPSQMALTLLPHMTSPLQPGAPSGQATSLGCQVMYEIPGGKRNRQAGSFLKWEPRVGR